MAKRKNRKWYYVSYYMEYPIYEPADKPLEEISKLPMPENGFCLEIPDDKEN